jgi:hypothetical protein
VAMLDELDEPDTDGLEEMGTVRPPQIHVLEGDDIPTPGDTLGPEVLSGGRSGRSSGRWAQTRARGSRPRGVGGRRRTVEPHN